MVDNISSIKDLINLLDNLNCYQCLSHINDDSDLGYYWIEESGCYDTTTLGSLAYYIDYEKLGRDIRLEQGGSFTLNGYVYQTDNSFINDYDGRVIPSEYCILS